MVRRLLRRCLVAGNVLVLVAALTSAATGSAAAASAGAGGQFLCGGKLGLDETDTCDHWYIAAASTNTMLHTDASLSSPPRPGDRAYSEASTQFAVIFVAGNPIYYRTLYAFATATCEQAGSLAPPPSLAGTSVVTGLTVVGWQRTIPDTTEYQKITTPTADIELNVRLRVSTAGGGAMLVLRPLVITPHAPGSQPIIPVEARVGYDETEAPALGGGPCRS